MGDERYHWISCKQNLKDCFLTETEMIETSEYVSFNVWMVMFPESQLYEIKKNIIFQDNQSTINMSNNGSASCTGNSRHINIRHFFANYRVDKVEIEVQYCPTHLMIADYFTKSLQEKCSKCIVIWSWCMFIAKNVTVN